MAHYTLSLIRDGEAIRQVNRECGDDLDALDAALLLCRDHVVEVYAESRFVARIEAGEEPLPFGLAFHHHDPPWGDASTHDDVPAKGGSMTVGRGNVRPPERFYREVYSEEATCRT